MHIGQTSRLLDHHAQLLDVHGKHDALVLLDERAQDRGRQHAVVEVRTQGQHDDDRATWFAERGDYQLQELVPLFLSTRLREQFLKLVDNEQYPGSLALRQSGGQLMQPAC